MRRSPLLSLGTLSILLAAALDSSSAHATERWVWPGPPCRESPALVLDSGNDRLVLHGGWDGNDLPDTWVYPLATNGPWQQLEITGARPPARSSHVAIYDPVRERMIVTGGEGSAGTMNVWALTLDGPAAWELLATAGVPPSTRSGTAAVYDPDGDRLVLFGGTGALSDVWQLTLDGTPTWSELTPVNAGPSGRSLAASVYDPVRQCMVVFGGFPTGSPPYANDTWALALTGALEWTELAPAGTPPARRRNAALIHDSVRDRFLLFGGHAAHGQDYEDVWALSTGATPTWTQIPVGGSIPSLQNQGQRVVYDAPRDRAVAFGGTPGTRSTASAWTLPLSGPADWVAHGDPRVHEGVGTYASAYDVSRDRMWLYGGEHDPTLGPVVGVDLTGARPIWVPVTPVGTLPHDLTQNAMVYDPVGDRLLAFGETSGAPGEIWQLDLAGGLAWSQIATAGTPPVGRSHHTLTYDPVRHRVIVYGGVRASGIVVGDVWALDLTGTPTWSQLLAGGGPGERHGHSATYDPDGDRLLVFGGAVVNAPTAADLRNDVWALSLSGPPAWNLVTPAGAPPDGRHAHAAVLDGARGRVLFDGGWVRRLPSVFTKVGETWELTLTPSPAWVQLSTEGETPPGRVRHAAHLDPGSNRIVLWNVGWMGNFHVLEGIAANSAPDPRDGRPAALRISPNPGRGTPYAEFSLMAPGPVTIEVLDVAGRRVTRRHWDELPAGPQRLGLEAAYEPGVHFVRVRADGRARRAKLCILE